jgi:Ca2+/Na+ antiporter
MGHLRIDYGNRNPNRSFGRARDAIPPPKFQIDQSEEDMNKKRSITSQLIYIVLLVLIFTATTIYFFTIGDKLGFWGSIIMIVWIIISIPVFYRIQKIPKKENKP